MRKLTIFLMFCSFISFECYSQNEKEFIIGKTIEFESKTLSRKELVQLYLPDSFKDNTGKKYPVIYLFDGNQFFHSVTGIVKTLSKAKKIPESIVVAVNPERDYCYTKEKIELYLNFIDKELQPFIKNNYSSSSYNIAIANSLNGQIGLYEMLLNKNLFQTYILSSPFFTLAEYLYDTEYFLNQQNRLNKNIFLSVGFEHEQKVDKIFKLSRLFNRAPVDNFYWEYLSYEEKNMEMILIKTITECLPKVFEDLHLPQIATSNDFNNKFQNREKLYAKYGCDLLNISSSPKSASREILNSILHNNEISESFISDFSTNPYFFLDEVELSNLANYLTSINKSKEATLVKKFIRKPASSTILNNYTSKIELERGLAAKLSFEKEDVEKTNSEKIEYINTNFTKGINHEENSAIEFTARNGAVKIKYDTEINPSKSISISCWLNPRTLNPADSWAISFKPGNSGPHWNTTVGMYPDQWGFEIYSIARVVYLVRDTIPLNTWTHIVIVADQTIGQLSFFKNGEKILERNDLIPFVNSTEFLQIGNDIHSFDGSIDEFRLYQRVISEFEIKELFKQKKE
jgi:predicted alpha/beta superfamily hydrolase